ncbi:hypothetical protein G5T41_03905 [Acinetobacter sp. GFQ9D192M]|uniref:hypothetical protein n=1 Tax=unclassified Acinetobacter TaxID=196816 RepID=UPI00140D33D0|nr:MULTISPECIES: hypothetical protein [unclassified Acinetobacter]NHB66980.1 hypothetical protein [Acinetobacter sp. GFQ9D191M]NHB99684.1 hypothetical protein [Acinetobacter sp. GFQ9D192M]
MWEFLNNSWVVGVVGGLISGLLVWLITTKLFKSKQTREYTHKVITVNGELIYSLRSGISQRKLPSLDVLDALKNATARKYSVDVRDIYTNKELAEELIKEIMDSSFIPVESKDNFFELLNPLLNEMLPQQQEEVEKKNIKKLENRNDAFQAISMILAIFVAFSTFLNVIWQPLQIEKQTLLGLMTSVFFPVMSTMMAILVTMLAFKLKLKMKKEEAAARLKNSETDDNLIINVKSYKRISKDKNNIDEAS